MDDIVLECAGMDFTSFKGLVEYILLNGWQFPSLGKEVKSLSDEAWEWYYKVLSTRYEGKCPPAIMLKPKQKFLYLIINPDPERRFYTIKIN